MSSQITFYEKNFINFDNSFASITATQGNEFTKYLRNSNLSSGWATTESEDSDNTTLTFNLGESFSCNTFVIAKHNLKHFKLQKSLDGVSYTDIEEVTAETESTTFLSFTDDLIKYFKLIIYETQVSDDDKFISRVLITKKIGKFNYWPKIESPTHDKNIVVKRLLSGKYKVLKQVGAFMFKASVSHWKNIEDLELIENLYNQLLGFEVSISGGDEQQFFYASEGYKKENIYLMQLKNNYSPEFVKSIYVNGQDLELDFVEVVE